MKVGIEDNERAEILEGLHEGETVVSTGAGALRRNDQLVVAGRRRWSSDGRGARSAPDGPGRAGRRTRSGGSADQWTAPRRSEQAAQAAERPARRRAAPARQQRPIASSDSCQFSSTIELAWQLELIRSGNVFGASE